jgi:hypothetical protein
MLHLQPQLEVQAARRVCVTRPAAKAPAGTKALAAPPGAARPLARRADLWTPLTPGVRPLSISRLAALPCAKISSQPVNYKAPCRRLRRPTSPLAKAPNATKASHKESISNRHLHSFTKHNLNPAPAGAASQRDASGCTASITHGCPGRTTCMATCVTCSIKTGSIGLVSSAPPGLASAAARSSAHASREQPSRQRWLALRSAPAAARGPAWRTAHAMLGSSREGAMGREGRVRAGFMPLVRPSHELGRRGHGIRPVKVRSAVARVTPTCSAALLSPVAEGRVQTNPRTLRRGAGRACPTAPCNAPQRQGVERLPSPPPNPRAAARPARAPPPPGR